MISVIIVVQNGESYIDKAIESVISQTYKPTEILVVDGNSSDRTEEIVKTFDKVRYIKQQGSGLANARNTGIDSASEELIAFLDHDDYWTPDKLENQVSHFIDFPQIQYSYANLNFFLESGCTVPERYNNQNFYHEHIGRTPGTMIARRSLFEAIGKFDPRFRIACDADWFTRAKDNKIKVAYIPKVLLHKRIHENNLSRDIKTNKEEFLIIMKESIQRQHQYVS
ncbi:MAG: glycosyltransferase [Pseudanabaena sp. ELA645]|jgi:glycosyltransferase involved in cell wall biosynthesis